MSSTIGLPRSGRSERTSGPQWRRSLIRPTDLAGKGSGLRCSLCENPIAESDYECVSREGFARVALELESTGGMS